MLPLIAEVVPTAVLSRPRSVSCTTYFALDCDGSMTNWCTPAGRLSDADAASLPVVPLGPLAPLAPPVEAEEVGLAPGTGVLINGASVARLGLSLRRC